VRFAYIILEWGSWQRNRDFLKSVLKHPINEQRKYVVIELAVAGWSNS
jgi:hypothetical protein